MIQFHIIEQTYLYNKIFPRYLLGKIGFDTFCFGRVNVVGYFCDYIFIRLRDVDNSQKFTSTYRL